MPMRILVAEDNLDNREMLVRRLERRGFDVAAVENGRQALESACSMVPDVILMDLSMPVMSGLEATRALRAHSALRHGKVIALTAHVLPAVREALLSAGCDAFAAKPMDFAALLTTIASVTASPLPQRPAA
jgi:two-component system cell cycle response regulator DivK